MGLIMYMHKIENEFMKEEISYGGGGTWYMNSTLEELKKLRLHLANFHLHYWLGALLRKS